MSLGVLSLIFWHMQKVPPSLVAPVAAAESWGDSGSCGVSDCNNSSGGINQPPTPPHAQPAGSAMSSVLLTAPHSQGWLTAS